MRWLVCVDGSDLALKTLKVASTFIRAARNTEDGDELSLVHVHDDSVPQPIHRSASHIEHLMDVEMLKCRHAIEASTGKGLTTSYHALPQTPQSGKIGVRDALEDFTQMATQTRPVMVFMGSWGNAGEKIDALGTLTDGLVCLTKTSIVVVKNTAPAPDPVEGTKFLVCIDGSDDSFNAAWWIRRLAKPQDTLDCLLGVREGELISSEEPHSVLERLENKLRSAREDGKVLPTTRTMIMHNMISSSVGAQLCEEAQRCEADFIVVASRGLNHCPRFGQVLDHTVGSVSLYIAHHSRVHCIIMKPCTWPVKALPSTPATTKSVLSKRASALF